MIRTKRLKMRFFSKIADIWRHEELRNKIGITLGLILVYRIGAHIALPGVDVASLKEAESSGNGFGDLLDLFTGGAFNSASIFALGIMPYISASIIIQLLGSVIPYFQRLQKEGELGRRKIIQLTRYGTVIIATMQAIGVSVYLFSLTAIDISKFFLPFVNVYHLQI